VVATGGEISGELEEMGFWVFFWDLFHGWRMVFLNNRSRVFFFFFLYCMSIFWESVFVCVIFFYH